MSCQSFSAHAWIWVQLVCGSVQTDTGDHRAQVHLLSQAAQCQRADRMPIPCLCQPCVPSGLPLPVQTSVFTPAYGSTTNVRVNSTMTTLQVLTLLLNKFRVSLAVGSLAPDAGGWQFCWGGGWWKPWLLGEG